MTAGLEKLANGKVAFADSRKDAWHQLGQLDQGVMTAEEALEKAYLANWNVRTTPLQTTATVNVGGEEVPFQMNVPRHFASVRTNPVTGLVEVLGVVGNSYVPIQNEEHIDFMNTLLEQSGAHVETAGSLNGGKNVFVTMQLPDFMQVAGKDAYKLYLAALNSHDGNGSYRLITTPVRVVCANTQAAALKNFVSSYTVRHTRNAKTTIAQAQQALELTFKYAEEFEREMEKLLDQKFTVKQMDGLMDKLWTPPAKDASRTILGRHEEKLTVVKGLFQSSPNLKDYRNTRYAAYNAVTDYLDHFSPTPSTGDAATVRAERTLTSAPVRETKEKAFALLSA